MFNFLNKKKYLLKGLLFLTVFGYFVLLSTPVFISIKAEATEVKTSIENPLPNIDTVPKFITALIKVVLYVGVPIVALAIIYTGFLFVSAQGKPEKLTTAKKALVYTLIGAALLLGAFIIANAIVSTVNDIGKNA